MGADIHFYLEVVQEEEKQDEWKFVREIEINRCYAFFDAA